MTRNHTTPQPGAPAPRTAPPTFAPAGALEAELALQRQVNRRLLALWDQLEAQPNAADDKPAALQVKVAAALTAGNGQVARLLRSQRALDGQAADGLSAAIAAALDELSTDLGVAL